MRMPGTKITGADGKEMEGNPRTVDIAVTRPIGESYTGRDSQLDAAAKELLAEIGK
jgi:tricorn protease